MSDSVSKKPHDARAGLVKQALKPLAPVGEGVVGMVKTWGLMARCLTAVAPVYFRVVEWFLHMGMAFSLGGYLYFMVKVATKHASKRLVSFAYYWLQVPIGVYGDWSDPLYQKWLHRKRDGKGLPSPHGPERVEWRKLALYSFLVTVVGTPIGILSGLIGRHVGIGLAVLFGVPDGVGRAALIQFVSVPVAAVLGTLTITYLVVKGTRPATVTGGEDMHAFAARWVWRKLLRRSSPTESGEPAAVTVGGERASASDVRRVRRNAVLVLPLWLSPLILAFAAPSVSAFHSWFTSVVLITAVNGGVKPGIEILSGYSREWAETNRKPVARSAVTYRKAMDLQSTVKYDCASILLSYLVASLIFNVGMGNKDPVAFLAFLPLPAMFISGPIAALTAILTKKGHQEPTAPVSEGPSQEI